MKMRNTGAQMYASAVGRAAVIASALFVLSGAVAMAGEIDDLIDSLVKVTWATDSPRPLSPELSVDTFQPAIDLRRRGFPCLPALLSALDDARETGLVIQRPDVFELPMICLSPEWYDPKRRSFPIRRERDYRLLPGDRYAIRVGDVCYYLIGRIVNRELRMVTDETLHGMPWRLSGVTQNSRLRRAVRDDWEGVSAGEYLKVLRDDALCPGSILRGDALRLTIECDRQAAISVGLELLARQVYDEDEVMEFIDDNLVGVPIPVAAARVREFSDRRGNAMAAILPLWTRGRVAVSDVFPKWDPLAPVDAITGNQLADVVREFRGVISRSIDQAASDALFRSAGTCRDIRCLANECVERLGEYSSFREECETRKRNASTLREAKDLELVLRLLSDPISPP